MYRNRKDSGELGGFIKLKEEGSEQTDGHSEKMCVC